MKSKVLTILVCLALIGAVAYGIKYNVDEKDTTTWFAKNNEQKSVPSKDYIKMKHKLEKENKKDLICVGTVMCHDCGKIKHICDMAKNEKNKYKKELQNKCLDWYCGELVWYCEDCIGDTTN